MTDQEAFDRMKDGDRAAMAWVYRNYRDRIAHFLMGKHATCGEEEARDIALDTVVRLATSLEKGKITELKSQLTTLLIGIAKYIYLETLKKQLPPSDDYNLSEVLKDDEDPWGIGIEEREIIEGMLDDLKPIVDAMDEPCRTILTKYYWEGLTDKAIGVLIGKSGEAAKQKRRHCIKLLGKRFFKP